MRWVRTRSNCWIFKHTMYTSSIFENDDFRTLSWNLDVCDRMFENASHACQLTKWVSEWKVWFQELDLQCQLHVCILIHLYLNQEVVKIVIDSLLGPILSAGHPVEARNELGVNSSPQFSIQSKVHIPIQGSYHTRLYDELCRIMHHTRWIATKDRYACPFSTSYCSKLSRSATLYLRHIVYISDTSYNSVCETT